MENTQPKRYLSGRNLLLVFLLFLFSCTSLQQAVTQDKPVIIKVYRASYSFTPQFYSCEVKKKGDEKEFYVTRDSVTVIYELPSNKLSLLYGIELGLKDIKANRFSEYKVIIQAYKTRKSYRVNTDIIANFITGLHKK